MEIRKAVIAVAGFGTRFLPATKVLPKELIPIVDKPIVQYLVEEAVASGIEDIILVIAALELIMRVRNPERLGQRRPELAPRVRDRNQRVEEIENDRLGTHGSGGVSSCHTVLGRRCHFDEPNTMKAKAL